MSSQYHIKGKGGKNMCLTKRYICIEIHNSTLKTVTMFAKTLTNIDETIL